MTDAPPSRLWVLLLLTYWALSFVILVSVPIALPQLAHGMLATVAGHVVWGPVWSLAYMTPPAIAIGVLLGLASAACVRATKLSAPHCRRGRWLRYLGALFSIFAAVVAVVHLLAPTATAPVATYTAGTVLLAAGSCLLLKALEITGLLTPPSHRSPLVTDAGAPSAR